MTNIIEVDFKSVALKDARFVAHTAEDVRLRCKELLEYDDYEEFLLAIMDEEYYVYADKEIRDLVDAYFDRIEG